jgi:hypothetical protein
MSAETLALFWETVSIAKLLVVVVVVVVVVVSSLLLFGKELNRCNHGYC